MRQDILCRYFSTIHYSCSQGKCSIEVKYRHEMYKYTLNVNSFYHRDLSLSSHHVLGVQAGVAGPSDHELALTLQRQDAAGVERDQAWSQFKQSQLGGEGGQLSE